MSIITNITDQKSLQEALREREYFIQRVAEVIPGIIYIYDIAESRNIYINHQVSQILGYTPEQMQTLGSQVLQNLVHPDDFINIMSAHQQLPTISDGKVLEIEYRMRHANGEWRWLLSRDTIFLRNPDGSPKQLLGTAQDITHRKQTEEVLQAVNQELEIRVQQRTNELSNAINLLSKALAQEKELNELKSHFVSMACHEFRTPLSTILSSADLMEYYVQEGAGQNSLEHIQRIQIACLNMTELLNDILVIGSAQAGKLDFNPSPLDLVDFCDDLVEEMQLTVNSKHQLIFVSQSQNILACMDEKLLWHILTNLLSNAIKYSPDGGNVQVKLLDGDGVAVLQIQDQGIGIPKEDQVHLFESFHRAKNVGNIIGTGLGLAIVKRSVELHNGQIAIASEVGVGTTVTVTLPLNSSNQTNEENSSD